MAPGSGSASPGVNGTGTPMVLALAWCYGDLGIAAVLVLAAQRTGKTAMV